MAAKKKYISKAVTTSIRAVSRASIKIRDNFFTVEYGEERSIPDDANLEAERKLLWETCNREVDTQIEEIYETFRDTKK